MKRISICTPCYNEANNIRRCYETVRQIFETQLPGYEREHIFADNCSTDGTVEILRDIAAADPQAKVILNARNFGIIRSSVNGIFSATGDAVFMFVPADLQDPPELMPEFVKLWEQGNDVVYGIRQSRSEPKIMVCARKFYYFTLRKLSHVVLPMNLSDFQLLDRKIVNAMQEFDDAYPFVRAMPFQCSSKTVGVPYHWRAREAGISKNRIIHLIDQGLNGIIATTHVPMRIALFVGFGVSLCSLAYAVVNVVASIVDPNPQVSLGIRTLIAGMFLFNGIIIFFLGVLGEYILSIHQQVRRPPRVVESERLNFDEPAASHDYARESKKRIV